MTVNIKICMDLAEDEYFDITNLKGDRGQVHSLVFTYFMGDVRPSADSQAFKYKKDGTVGNGGCPWYPFGEDDQIPQMFFDRARSMMKAEVTEVLDKLDAGQS